jgi:C4-dicarboxylate transporter DctQ subunit
VPRLVLPLGYALLFFRFAQVLVRTLRGTQAGLLVDEAEEALKLRPTDAGGAPGGRE